jgi:hypothetical protein
VLNANLPDDHIHMSKCEHFRSLASFREFLAIHWDDRYIVQYVWDAPDHGWLRDHHGDTVLTMNSIPVRLPLGDVFGGT